MAHIKVDGSVYQSLALENKINDGDGWEVEGKEAF